jgi:hypothetical protein
MAIPTNAFSQYGVGYPYSASGVNVSVIGTREDASNTLTMIDPDEAMSLAVLSKTTTNGLRHEWFTDTMQATSLQAALPGEDWGQGTNKVLKARTRLTNFVEWKRQDWSITMDELLLSQRGQLFGVPDELRYQMGKGGQEVNRNMDARLWAPSSGTGATATTYGSASGADTVLSQFATFRAWASASGISYALSTANGAFITAAFYDLQERMWTAGAKPDTIFCSPGVKSDISRTLLGDTSSPATQTGAQGIPGLAAANVFTGGEYGPVVDFIRTDFGRVAMVVDRWINQASAIVNTTATDQNAALFLVEKAKLRVAWWRPIRPYQVASTGDNVKVYILGAATTEVLHPTAIGQMYNITT